MARQLQREQVGECRACGRFCDRMVEPRGCIERGCPYLYSYDDELTGRRFMGCLYKVFSVEIDVELFEEAERTRLGWGAVKMTGRPFPHCSFSVEPAYGADGCGSECMNPRFLDSSDPGPGGFRDFDLRDRLAGG